MVTVLEKDASPTQEMAPPLPPAELFEMVEECIVSVLEEDALSP